jgi:hypothetical protein
MWYIKLRNRADSDVNAEATQKIIKYRIDSHKSIEDYEFHSRGLKNFMLPHHSGKYLTSHLKIALLAFLWSLSEQSRLTSKYEFHSLLSVFRYCWLRKIELNLLNWNCSIKFSTRQLKIFTRHGRADERTFQALLIWYNFCVLHYRKNLRLALYHPLYF